MYRTHHCNELRESHIGQTVTLIGWVNSARDHGGVIFIDLRDREGLTQCVFHPEENPEVAEALAHLREEDVIQVTGVVSARLEGTVNDKLGTGAIEIVAKRTRNREQGRRAAVPARQEVSNEDLRMKYRYLDLRRARMSKNIRQRAITRPQPARLSRRVRLLRNRNADPLQPDARRRARLPRAVAASTPAVSTRCRRPRSNTSSSCMVAGLEKYFQIARCFRDEDLRADRQPEFTQIDIEASLHHQDDIQTLVEGLLASHVQSRPRASKSRRPFPRMTYRDAMDRLRLRQAGHALRHGDHRSRAMSSRDTAVQDLPLASSTAAASIKAINAKGFAGITTGQMNRLNEIADGEGRVRRQRPRLHQVSSKTANTRVPLWKFFSEAEKAALIAKLDIEEGDIVFFGAGTWDTVCTILGRVRTASAPS